MPRFYSAEWVAAFNEQVAGVDPASVDLGASLAATGGRFSVTQVIEGAPAEEGGPGEQVVATLSVDDHTVTLALGPPDSGRADVTVLLSWTDVAAMSRGELDAAGALAAGRVRVRGDLAVLVAAQGLLAEAAGRLADLQAATTY